MGEQRSKREQRTSSRRIRGRREKKIQPRSTKQTETKLQTKEPRRGRIRIRLIFGKRASSENFQEIIDQTIGKRRIHRCWKAKAKSQGRSKRVAREDPRKEGLSPQPTHQLIVNLKNKNPQFLCSFCRFFLLKP